MEHLQNAKGLLGSKTRNKEDKEKVALITIEDNQVTIPIEDDMTPDILLRFVKEVYVSINARAPHKEHQQTISHLDASISLQERLHSFRGKDTNLLQG